MTAVSPEMNDIYGDTPRPLEENEIHILLDECAKEIRTSQKRLYALFFEYAMSICMRYADTGNDALEILNDGFLKVFREIRKFEPLQSNPVGAFKAWMKKIMIFTAIDHYRKNQKYNRNTDDLKETVLEQPAQDETQLEKLSHKEIMECVVKLPPAYRTVFSLFVIDGFSHNEIAERMGISTGTSKSNLAKARAWLQKMLTTINKEGEYERRAVL
jgi:RNA polymerase sigma factor (sigma-70 family)